jgi:hypothetical protein
LRTQAYRRPIAEKDHARLMTFYARGRKEKNFEAGVTRALEAIPRQARSSCSESKSLRSGRPRQVIASVITSSRRDCHSSCGDVGPTPS